MASSVTTFQDLPPKGGFASITTDRIKPKIGPDPRRVLIGVFVMQAMGIATYYFVNRNKKRHKIEMRSAQFALKPLMDAERDRAVLLQMKRNREEERKVMKDVRGWRVGTYFGEPVFLSLDENTYVEPTATEYAMHSSDDDRFPVVCPEYYFNC